MFCWQFDQYLLRAVKPISRSQWNGGFGADSGTSRGDPCRRAFHPTSHSHSTVKSTTVVESPEGISPPGAPRTVHDSLESHGSRCSAVALNGFASSMGSSRFRLASGQGRTTQPLRSRPITGPSTLLRAAPPLGTDGSNPVLSRRESATNRGLQPRRGAADPGERLY